MKELSHEHKKEFQVERIVFFSDAVFAIAITLLIIEIKVPVLSGHTTSEHSFLEAFSLLVPKLLGFVLSFFIIGLYWSLHHRMFGYVTNYSGKLVWLNLFFLFSIVLMPFSSAVYSEYSMPEYVHLLSPYVIYVANICLTGLANFFLWNFIGNRKNELTENFPAGDFLQKAKIRTLLLPAVFVLSLLVSWLVDPVLGRFVLFLIPVLMAFVRNKQQISH